MRGKYLYKFLIVLLFAVGFVGFSPSAQAYGDSDNIPKIEENASPNDGDNNFDGTKDGYQSDVATTQNPNDLESPGAWVSLEITSPEEESTSWQIDEFTPVDPATLPSQPDGSVFPVGMFDVKLSCVQRHNCYNDEVSEVSQLDAVVDETPVGDSVHLKLIFDRVMDTSKWTTQKYDPNTDTYIDYSPYVTISTQDFSGNLRTVLEWDIVDGGLGDADGLVNCQISDPIGPTVPIATSTSALVVPASKTTVTSPTLANTGFGTNLLISIAVILIAASVVIFPKRSQRQ